MSTLEHLAAADSALAKIFVNADNVMLMAFARQEIKAAFDELKKESEGKTDG